MATMQVLKKSVGVALPDNDGQPLTVIPAYTPRADVEALGEFVMRQLCDDHFVTITPEG